MSFFPIFVNLKNKNILVVGGGQIALRKVKLLLKFDTSIILLSPDLTQELQQLVFDNKIKHIAEKFDKSLPNNIDVVIAATDDELVNQQISVLAKSDNILVNVVDDLESSSFIVPSIVDRKPLIIAISSAGKAPVLVRMLREKIESLLSPKLSVLAKIAGKYRNKVKSKIKKSSNRRKFWEGIFEGDIYSQVLSGDYLKAESLLDESIENDNWQKKKSGEVFLIGAGPGDPELLTVKAVQVLQKADVVLYDNLVDEKILEYVRRDAELCFVGKKSGVTCQSYQDYINQKLIFLAKQGKQVCRLKGGDPFIFGRGGEELLALKAHNIKYQVIPGISAAIGCSAYSGIPLTHRDLSQSVTFLTAHLQADENIDWELFAKSKQTLVIYMGIRKLTDIASQLIKYGRSVDTPIAIVENGTREEQRLMTATLSELAEVQEKYKPQSPGLLIVGEVALLANELNWFGNPENYLMYSSESNLDYRELA